MRARIADDLAASTAMRADPLDHEETLLRANLAGAAAGRAGARAIVRRGAAAPVAQLARRQRLDRNRLLDPGERLFERQFQVVAKIRAARGILPLAARVHEFAEDRREDIGETVEALAAAERIPPPPFWNAALPNRS